MEAPPNVCTPNHLADAAAHIAAQHPDVFQLTVLEKEQCAALGMGSFLGVAEASEEPPKFIHLAYTPKGGAQRKVRCAGGLAGACGGGGVAWGHLDAFLGAARQELGPGGLWGCRAMSAECKQAGASATGSCCLPARAPPRTSAPRLAPHPARPPPHPHPPAGGCGGQGPDL